MTNIKAVNDDTNSSSIQIKYGLQSNTVILWWTLLSLGVNFHYTLKIITDVSFSLIHIELGTTGFIYFEI